ncbi:MAG: DUF3310 domain-containing protein [Campylobacterales bacterium]|nr:DUF3310 domain-containing protein [Campylobacterales bacterium]
MTNNAIQPKHYTELKIQPIDFIEANQEALSWALANVIKYISRHKKKNGIEDLKKAQWYLNHEIEKLEAVSNEIFERLI